MNSIGSQGQSDASKENISFVKDIQMMMFGLGDSPTPLQSTAAIVEKIVLQQLILIIGQAEEVAEKRGVDGIYPQDILFLMRKDIPKLNRIISYISMKEVRKNIANITSTDSISTNLEELSDDKGLTLDSKRKVSCVQFLLSVGVELGPADDPARQERLRRLDQHIQNMSMKTFYEHQQARRTAFAKAQPGVARFLDWLRQSCPENTVAVAKLKSFAVDMLLYLAKETIAQLIDMAQVLRLDAGVCPTDPLSRAAPPPPCDIFPPPPNRLVEGPPPITADEVREVLRRFYSPQLTPWSPFTCNVDPAVFNKIIAC